MTWILLSAFFAPMALVLAVAALFADRQPKDGYKRLQVLLGERPRSTDDVSLLAEQKPFQREWLNRLEGWLTRVFTLNYLVEQAGLKLSTTVFFGLCGLSGILGVAIALIVATPLPLVPVIGGVFSVIPLIWLLHRRKQRARQFAIQLTDALELISRGLRSGNSLAASMRMVSQEMLPPISHEFGIACQQQQLGLSVVDSLDDLTRRVPNDDLRFFCSSVRLQQRFGGNLAEILEIIAAIVRDRFHVLGQVQALTGEGRLSGVVLLLLPIAIFLGLYYLSPAYVMPLFDDPLGREMLGIAVLLQVVGAATIKKIIDIKM